MTDYRNIRDRRYRQGELSSRFPNISEEEKFRKEVIGEIAVWHTPEEVYQVYQQYHQQGETIEAILSNVRSSEIRQQEALSRQTKIIGGLSNLQIQSEENRNVFSRQYGELGRSIERVGVGVNEALEIVDEIKNQPASIVFYNEGGIKITESDMKRIFDEYFQGTNLEDVSYNWREILNPEYLADIAELYKIAKTGGSKSEIVQLLTGISGKLANSLGSINETNKKKARKAIKENDIRIWVLSVGVNKLRRDVFSEPKRVAINYKIDKGETASILTEINHRINRQFRTRFTPIDWIPWVAIGVVALVCFGLWFASRRRRIRR